MSWTVIDHDHYLTVKIRMTMIGCTWTCSSSTIRWFYWIFKGKIDTKKSNCRTFKTSALNLEFILNIFKDVKVESEVLIWYFWTILNCLKYRCNIDSWIILECWTFFFEVNNLVFMLDFPNFYSELKFIYHSCAQIRWVVFPKNSWHQLF